MPKKRGKEQSYPPFMAEAFSTVLTGNAPKEILQFTFENGETTRPAGSLKAERTACTLRHLGCCRAGGRPATADAWDMQ